YDEPRGLLRQVPGLELVEMSEAREESLCCGGGGGRLWMETPKGERFSDLRLGQGADAGARVVATSCPYCITMLEDSRLALKDSDALQIRDITEILAELV
ncbi:MAG TPA: (Fe-S)-binding protein, partial [Deferrisomatales bacterium]|nr:(Fe-S)-binding protein [Deferrisomatales bacterium]